MEVNVVIMSHFRENYHVLRSEDEFCCYLEVSKGLFLLSNPSFQDLRGMKHERESKPGKVLEKKERPGELF